MPRHPLLALVILVGCADPLALQVEITGTRTLPLREDGLRPIAVEVRPTDHALEAVYTDGGLLAFVALARASAGESGSGDTSERRAGGIVPFGPISMVSLGDHAHAVLGEGLGFHFDERAGSWRELFCLVPGAADGEWPLGLQQRSRALAHDPSTGRLWAQPRTFRRSIEPVRSEIAAWDDQTGEELGWWAIDTAFEAEAMAVLPEGILVLADWRALHAFDPATGAMAEIATLEELDVVSVRAMVWDPVDERVLALELPSQRVLALSLTR